MMYGQGKSDSPIVPMKSPNNAAPVAAEAMEGRGGPRAMRSGAARARRRAGKAYPPHWTAYVRPQDGTSASGSPHSFTMLASTCSAGRFTSCNGERRPASTVSRGTSTKQTSRATSRTCTDAYNGVRIGRSRRGVSTSPNLMAGSGHWASPRWRTRSSSGR